MLLHDQQQHHTSLEKSLLVWTSTMQQKNELQEHQQQHDTNKTTTTTDPREKMRINGKEKSQGALSHPSQSSFSSVLSGEMQAKIAHDTLKRRKSIGPNDEDKQIPSIKNTPLDSQGETKRFVDVAKGYGTYDATNANTITQAENLPHPDRLNCENDTIGCGNNNFEYLPCKKIPMYSNTKLDGTGIAIFDDHKKDSTERAQKKTDALLSISTWGAAADVARRRSSTIAIDQNITLANNVDQNAVDTSLDYKAQALAALGCFPLNDNCAQTHNNANMANIIESNLEIKNEEPTFEKSNLSPKRNHHVTEGGEIINRHLESSQSAISGGVLTSKNRGDTNHQHIKEFDCGGTNTFSPENSNVHKITHDHDFHTAELEDLLEKSEPGHNFQNKDLEAHDDFVAATFSGKDEQGQSAQVQQSTAHINDTTSAATGPLQTSQEAMSSLLPQKTSYDISTTQSHNNCDAEYMGTYRPLPMSTGDGFDDDEHHYNNSNKGCYNTCVAYLTFGFVTFLFVASMLYLISTVIRPFDIENSVDSPPGNSRYPTSSPHIRGSIHSHSPTTRVKRNDSNHPTPFVRGFAPTKSPITKEITADINRLQSFTSLLKTISNEKDLFDSSTPQYAARTWIALEDSMQLDPENTFFVTQRYAMAVLYFSTSHDNDGWKICGSDEGGSDDTNKINSPRDSLGFNCVTSDGSFTFRHLSGVGECDWYGVVCDEILNVVTSIEIVENGLSGTLPSELSELNYLEYLDLSHNYLKGPLPVLSERNRDLRKINLSNNTFTGTIPLSYGIPDKLRTLELGHNKLTGTIPSTLFTSGTIRHLLLNDNFLTGELPKELFETLSLQQLHLGDNDFGGEISSSFEKLRGLRALFLPNTGFTGSLPGSLFMLSELEYLSIEGNKVEGTIPTELFDGASKESLIYLNLGFNELAGGMSSRFAELTRLQFLGLNDNYFTGTIPSSLGEISSLTKVFLQNNAFFGNANFMCANDISEQLGALEMDCKEEVTCSCCTFCN